MNNQMQAAPAPASSFDLMVNIPVMEAMYRLAETMAGGKATVPVHLQGNTADCMAIVMQSALWKMNPFAVAQKTHLVNGTMGYEAQLVNSVVTSSGMVEGAFHYEFFGPWERVLGKFISKTNDKGKVYHVPGWSGEDEVGCGVRIYNTLVGESNPRMLELMLQQAQVRNSTLWASDPKQQLSYLAVKRWARLYCPAAILGVYSVDELEQAPTEHDITPKENVYSAMQQAKQGAETIAEQDPKATSDTFQRLALAVRDCTDMESLTEVKEAAIKAGNNGEFSKEQGEQLKKALNSQRLKITAPVDTETGEVATA
ncbi:RecT family recombinase [Shewanella algae]|uniref:RecT family recombinase n=1 Tax=Shewanella algae TaxID=38313 RepID=UPI00313DD4A8